MCLYFNLPPPPKIIEKTINTYKKNYNVVLNCSLTTLDFGIVIWKV